jgi:hypothetical protein
MSAMKRDHHTCIECENEYHDNHPWHRNALDQMVCDNCAGDLPKIQVRFLSGSGYFGEGKMRVIGGFQSVETPYFKTSEEARTDVLRMCRRQWVNASPIEEEEV